MSGQPITLMTGASGFVGGLWLARMLASGGGRKFIVLTRRPELFSGDRVTAIAADSHNVRPNNVTEIIHCAADIRFGISIEEARAANVEGTRRLLEFARRCPHLEKFAHISSVYAAGKLTGDFDEGPFPSSRGFFNSYQQSKYEAEQLVLGALPAVPAAIFRLSTIIGDSRGAVHQFNYFHHLLKMIPNSAVVPVMPGDPAAPVDLIASDWAVVALDYLFEHRFEPGRIFHVCAGPRAALPVRKLVDITFRRFGMRPPRLVSLAEYERFASARRMSSDGVVSGMLCVLDRFLPHLALCQSFHNARTAADLNTAGLPVPDIDSYYGQVVDYCIRTKWGRSALASANGIVEPPQSMRRDSHPVQELHAHPTDKCAGETAPRKPAR